LAEINLSAPSTTFGFQKLIIPFSLALHKNFTASAGTEEWEYSLVLCLKAHLHEEM